MELPQGGQPTGGSPSGQAACAQRRHVDLAGVGIRLGGTPAADGGKFGEVAEVPRIGFDGIAGGGALDRQHLQEGVEPGVFAGPLTIWAVFNSNIVYRQPVELVLALLAAARYIGSIRRNWSLLFITVWFISGLIFISAMSYSPLRYRFVFIVPTVILAAHLWTSLIADRVQVLTTRVSRFAQAIALTLLSFVGIDTILMRLGFHPGMALFYAGAATAGILIARRYARYFTLVSKPALGVALLAATLAIALPQWLDGEFHRGHGLQNIAMKVVAADPQMVLSGDVGAEIALWTDLDVYVNPAGANYCRITHLLTRESDVEVLPASWRGSYREIMRFVHPALSQPILLLEIDHNKLFGCPVLPFN